MNLRELEYLIAVDEERHFHRAAERCFVSQPTLSGQIKKLEQELGVLLIERNNRNVAMTEAGIAVVEHARKALIETNAIRKACCPLFSRPYGGGYTCWHHTHYCTLFITHHYAAFTQSF